MKKAISVLFVLGLTWCYGCSANAQVRVMHSALKKKHKKKRRHKKQRDVSFPRPFVTAKVSRVNYHDKNRDIDEVFYARWDIDKKLTYSDFRYNKNLYDKFFPAKDTDISNVIYPDYREFYKELSIRMNTADPANERFWQQKIEQVLTKRSDSVNDTSNISEDMTDLTFSFVIDSPAASVISIDPIIYKLRTGSYYYNIAPLFSKQESWMIAKSEDILLHEQIHFDIFELYARRMRKYLLLSVKRAHTTGSPNDLVNDITPTFDKLYKQLNALQYEFDRQTGTITESNGSLFSLNEKWTTFLKNKIEELAEYATPEGIISIE